MKHLARASLHIGIATTSWLIAVLLPAATSHSKLPHQVPPTLRRPQSVSTRARFAFITELPATGALFFRHSHGALLLPSAALLVSFLLFCCWSSGSPGHLLFSLLFSRAALFGLLRVATKLLVPQHINFAPFVADLAYITSHKVNYTASYLSPPLLLHDSSLAPSLHPQSYLLSCLPVANFQSSRRRQLLVPEFVLAYQSASSQSQPPRPLPPHRTSSIPICPARHHLAPAATPHPCMSKSFCFTP